MAAVHGIQNVADDLLFTSPEIASRSSPLRSTADGSTQESTDTECSGARPRRSSVVPEIASPAVAALPELSRKACGY